MERVTNAAGVVGCCTEGDLAVVVANCRRTNYATNHLINYYVIMRAKTTRLLSLLQLLKLSLLAGPVRVFSGCRWLRVASWSCAAMPRRLLQDSSSAAEGRHECVGNGMSLGRLLVALHACAVVGLGVSGCLAC